MGSLQERTRPGIKDLLMFQLALGTPNRGFEASQPRVRPQFHYLLFVFLGLSEITSDQNRHSETV